MATPKTLERTAICLLSELDLGRDFDHHSSGRREFTPSVSYMSIAVSTDAVGPLWVSFACACLAVKMRDQLAQRRPVVVLVHSGDIL